MRLAYIVSPVRGLRFSVLFLAFFLLVPGDAHAYIGPGAGFAFVSSFFILFIALFMAFFTLMTWPLRWVFQVIRGFRALRKSRVRRVVILGLDGQDPELTDQFLAEGILPNFARLRDMGCYKRLKTSLPAESPVAWSCFQTGCNPGKHKVFDFLVPNRKSYLPELCSAEIRPPKRNLKIGKYRIPLSKPQLSFSRKSQSFWKILGDHGVFSTVLRVPISFPPEKFNGVLLSAMAVPDLKGTQGTFSYYSSDPHEHAKYTGGMQFPVEVKNGVVKCHIAGPENTMVEGGGEIQVPFEARIGENGAPSSLIIGGESYELKLREYTPWIPVDFKPGLGIKVRGIVRFYLKETFPHFKLYMTPINIDPEKPALPVSSPTTYSIYLARTQGSFSTLGLAEDTWALNERVLDEEAFLKQTYLIHEERERMWFDALEKTRRGAVVCVFDITDRMQHMFFRYLVDDHPANEGKDTERHKNALRDMYIKMDELVGKTIRRVRDDETLFVMSDHGFKPFKRGVNLNSWLFQNGYLVLKPELHGIPSGAEWLQDVDWSKSRAYAIGLGGIYLNVSGREAQGIVKPGEDERALRKEIIGRLRGTLDPKTNEIAISEVYDCKEVYSGPYTREAPDLFVGFHVGWRASWNCATGAIDPEIFEDNVKSWSGDHCMNPPEVPGILFCNQKYEKAEPHIMDLGPTTMDLFGVTVPAYCDGESLFPDPAGKIK